MSESPENPEKSPSALREEAVLKFWQENNIFEKSLLQESPKGNFVFYDGPPYATGLPHYGHILPSTMKDIIPRYKTMQGYNVPRRWGWDCHGLPIENLIEKELGLKDKKAIEEYGIGKFNRAARDSVFRYAEDWKRIITRVGRWVDMDNDFQTMDPSYTESVWWSFKTLNEKGLVYETFRVMPFCPRCQTTLSNFEVNQGYKDIPDLSAYVKFQFEESTFFLAWTTTPWTLPGNTALAVNPDLDYVKFKVVGGDLEGQTYICAKAKLESVLEKGKIEEGNVTILETIKGSDLEGISYKPVFDFYTPAGTLSITEEPKRNNAWKVQVADFVTAEDGTGIVHIAPSFGDDDMKLSVSKNIPSIQHVAQNGEIKEGNGTLSGMNAKPKENPQQTDIEVIKLLAHQGSLFAKEKITHSYPHCWRCETPLLNYATSGWFVKATEMRDKLVLENKSINWVPSEVGEGRMGDWLENVRDWAVSRTRYWGAPLPVWRGEKTGKLEFIGSVSELKDHIQGNGNKYFLMRHGECESNVLNIMNSSEKDLNKYALTEKGRSEVEATSIKVKAREVERGKKITKIYASDFRRTRETAEHMADALGINRKHITYDKRLREIYNGDLDGEGWPRRVELLRTVYEKIFKRPPNGESVVDVKRRTAEFLYEIDAKHKDEDILVVTHGLPLRITIDTINGKTARDLLRSGWRDVSDPTASVHEHDFKALPHDENFELDIHRPYIDSIMWTTPDGDLMKRVPDVFDVWYDSGSMPYAQAHYPFENKEAFEEKGSSIFPADFISEGLDQTRGWFYSLAVLGMGLFGKSPYKNVGVTGLILAEDGRKMSKSLKNYPDLEPTLDKYGADSLRYMLACSPAAHAEEASFSEKSLDEVNKKIFNRLENVYSFYALYAESDAFNAKSKNVLDRWILARLAELKTDIEKGLDSYQIDKAARPISGFIDDFSTWYLQCSRDRFKGDNQEDKEAALSTTRFVLIGLTKIMAPFTPFVAEHIYLKVKSLDMPESVHLCSWPKFDSVDNKTIEAMEKTRKIVETGLALRSKEGIKVRQPLASFTYEEAGIDSDMEDIIKEKLNVKEIRRGKEMVLDTTLTEDLKEEGFSRDFIRAIQEKRKEKGLSKDDVISISISGDKVVVDLVMKYKNEIQKVVNSKDILEGSGETAVESDYGVLHFSIS